jgi:hypothetical protein
MGLPAAAGGPALSVARASSGALDESPGRILMSFEAIADNLRHMPHGERSPLGD